MGWVPAPQDWDRKTLDPLAREILDRCRLSAPLALPSAAVRTCVRQHAGALRSDRKRNRCRRAPCSGSRCSARFSCMRTTTAAAWFCRLRIRRVTSAQFLPDRTRQPNTRNQWFASRSLGKATPWLVTNLKPVTIFRWIAKIRCIVLELIDGMGAL
jgi:hypothetical protein